MKAVCVNVCDYNLLGEKGYNIIVCKSDKPILVFDVLRIIHSKMPADMKEYGGLIVRVTRTACISGFGSEGEGLNILEIESISLGLVKRSETVQ